MLADIEVHGIQEMTSNLMPPKVNFDLSFTVNIPNRDDCILPKDDLMRADICWFRDDSEILSGSGTSVNSCRPRRAISTCLGSYAAVFHADIFAIDLYVERLTKSDFAHKTIKIFFGEPSVSE